MTIPQIQFGFFMAFKQSVWRFYGLFLALFGFLLNCSSGNPASWPQAVLSWQGCHIGEFIDRFQKRRQF